MTSECVEWLSKTFALWGCPESTFPSFWCQCLDFRLDTFFSCPCSPCISEWSEPSASSDVFPDWLKLIFIILSSYKSKGQKWSLGTLENNDALGFREHSLFLLYLFSFPVGKSALPSHIGRDALFSGCISTTKHGDPRNCWQPSCSH